MRALPRLAGGLWLLLIACSDGNAASGEAPQATPHSSAKESTAKTPPRAEDGTTPASAPAAPGYRDSRKMMGTFIEMTVLDLPEPAAKAAVDDAFAEMQRLEAVLSEWRADSEISRINQRAGKGPVSVGPDTLAVVRAGLQVSKWSDGAFDLSWAALRGLYLFQPGDEKIPNEAEIAARLPLVRYADITLDEEKKTVELGRPDMLIGTGGIAKGYALDRAAEILRRAGAKSFMFFGGGQIQLHGQKAGRPWRVGIQHPRRNDYFAFLESSGGSVSTSGDYEHAFVRDGKRWHHLLDPRTGLPVQHTMSVTVVAESGLYADAMSTACFIMGSDKCLAKLPSAPSKADVAIVDADGLLRVSPGMQDKLVLRAPLRPDGRLP